MHKILDKFKLSVILYLSEEITKKFTPDEEMVKRCTKHVRKSVNVAILNYLYRTLKTPKTHCTFA
jgi:hypothetical protein